MGRWAALAIVAAQEEGALRVTLGARAQEPLHDELVDAVAADREDRAADEPSIAQLARDLLCQPGCPRDPLQGTSRAHRLPEWAAVMVRTVIMWGALPQKW